MLSNYPPGVTGLEPQIAGGRSGGEVEIEAEEVECLCGEVTESVAITAELENGNLYGEWTCKTCGHVNDWDADSIDYLSFID